MVNILGDLLILSLPIAGADTGLRSLADMPPDSVRTGAIVGLLVIPAWFGLLPVLRTAIARAPRWAIAFTVAGFAQFVVMSAVFHGAFVLFGEISHAVSDGEAAASLLASAEAASATYVTILVGGLAVMTIGLAGATISGRSAFPRWIALVSPLLLVPALQWGAGSLPAPVGGLLMSVAATSGTLVFFVAVMLTTAGARNIQGATT